MLIHLGEHRRGHRRVRRSSERLWRELRRWRQADRAVEPAEGGPSGGQRLLEVMPGADLEESFASAASWPRSIPGLGSTGLVDLDSENGRSAVTMAYLRYFGA